MLQSYSVNNCLCTLENALKMDFSSFHAEHAESSPLVEGGQILQAQYACWDLWFDFHEMWCVLPSMAA